MVPALFLYLLKLTVSLGLVYVFYRLVLQNLTFYNWNRWYLLGFTALSLLIPLIDVSSLWQAGRPVSLPTVAQYIPSVEAATRTQLLRPEAAGIAFTIWDWLLLVMLTGTGVLLVRTAGQFFSFVRIRRMARLISNEGIKMYQVDANILPFSFGRSIFLNQALHPQEDLAEIIRHELVHVRQGHTADIIWMELVGILNWYNPLVWLLRRQLRQNLEFIADNQVLQAGVDKKHYQYLLLQVTGNPAFRLANQFNFSSLKKRIVMMNKMPSTRIQLIKFLLVLPLILVLLLACQGPDEVNKPVAKDARFITVTGLVVNADTYEPLSRAHLKDENSKAESFTDNRGFYTLKIPVSKFPVEALIQVKKAGFANMQTVSEFSKPALINKKKSHTEFIGLVASQNNTQQSDGFVSSYTATDDSEELAATSPYEVVLELFEMLKTQQQDKKKLFSLINDSEKPYWVVNGKSYLVGKGSVTQVDEVTEVIFVDGKRMTGEEVNANIKRSSIISTGTRGEEDAFKKYGIKQPVLEIYMNTAPSEREAAPPRPGNGSINEPAKNSISTNRGNEINALDQGGPVKQFIPPTLTPDQLPEDHKLFMKYHSQVKNIGWRQDGFIVIFLKSGKREEYDLNDPASKAIAEKKYGDLPKNPLPSAGTPPK